MDDLEKQFSLEIWLPNAARRASQLTIASHPSKFSHPDAKTSIAPFESLKNRHHFLLNLKTAKKVSLQN